MRTATEFRIKSGDVGKAVELEIKIDAAIDAAATFGAEQVKVSTVGFKAGTIARVLEDYEKAGWKTQFVLDARDGDYIQMEPRK